MGFPNGGEGGGSPTWEKFPHFPVIFFGERPLAAYKKQPPILSYHIMMGGVSTNS